MVSVISPASIRDPGPDSLSDEHGSGCQQSWNVRTLARVNLAGSCTILVNDANLSQGESERSERSQIEDVTNYS